MNLFIPHFYQITAALFSIISGGFYYVPCFCLSFVIVETISRWHCGCCFSLSYPCIFYTPPEEKRGWFEASGSFLSCLLRLFEIKFKKTPGITLVMLFFSFCVCFFCFLIPSSRQDKRENNWELSVRLRVATWRVKTHTHKWWLLYV